MNMIWILHVVLRIYIKYSFILGGDGNAYVGRGWRRAPIVPAESGCNNLRTLVFARIGPIKGTT